jgi:hypothetical protein
VKRAWSSVQRRVEAMVMRALARAQGIRAARNPTARLEARPTPPPQRTKRAKEASGPGAVSVRSVFMGFPSGWGL